MGRLLLLLAVGLALAAFLLPLGAEAPRGVEVARGDTLSGLAREHGVSVQELMDWNQLGSDRIAVGQRLVLGEARAGATAWQRLREMASPSREELPTAEPSPVAEPVSRVGTGNSRPGIPRGPDGQQPSAPAPSPLRMPAPKPCLADSVVEGQGMGRSVGLDPAAVGDGVRGFQAQALRCYEGRSEASGTVVLRLAVGCDGRVLRSAVRDDGSGVPGFAACVAEVFRYAPFPVHARDEVEVDVPLHFVADTGASP